MLEVQQRQNKEHQLLQQQHLQQSHQQEAQEAAHPKHFIYHETPPRAPSTPVRTAAAAREANKHDPYKVVSNRHTTQHPSSAPTPATRHSVHPQQAGRQTLMSIFPSPDSPQRSSKSASRQSSLSNDPHNNPCRSQPQPLPLPWVQPVVVFRLQPQTSLPLLLHILRSHVLKDGPVALIVPWTSLQDATDVLLLMSEDITSAAPGHSMVVTPLTHSEQDVFLERQLQQRRWRQKPGPDPEALRAAFGEDAIFQTDVSDSGAQEFVLVVSTCLTERLQAAALVSEGTSQPSLPHTSHPAPAPSGPQHATQGHAPPHTPNRLCSPPPGDFETLLQDGRAAAIGALLECVACGGQVTMELRCRYDPRSIREAFQVLSDTGSLLRSVQARTGCAGQQACNRSDLVDGVGGSAPASPDSCRPPSNEHSSHQTSPPCADQSELLEGGRSCRSQSESLSNDARNTGSNNACGNGSGGGSGGSGKHRRHDGVSHFPQLAAVQQLLGSNPERSGLAAV
ncbi:MAG: hypothetical protein WDW38_001946 [Sanguina aurantia]